MKKLVLTFAFVLIGASFAKADRVIECKDTQGDSFVVTALPNGGLADFEVTSDSLYPDTNNSGGRVNGVPGVPTGGWMQYRFNDTIPRYMWAVDIHPQLLDLNLPPMSGVGGWVSIGTIGGSYGQAIATVCSSSDQ